MVLETSFRASGRPIIWWVARDSNPVCHKASVLQTDAVTNAARNPFQMFWQGVWDSNPQQPQSKCGALPIELTPDSLLPVQDSNPRIPCGLFVRSEVLCPTELTGNKFMEEDNRIELSPFHQQWDGFHDRVRAMQPIFHLWTA